MIHDDQRDFEETLAQAEQNGSPEPPPQVLPKDNIPESWQQYYSALKVIRDFTQKVERDLCLLQDLWLAYVEAITSFGILRNPIATQLQAEFTNRFTSTHDINIARLAYYLTPIGLQELRKEMSSRLFRPTYDRLKALFRAIAVKTFGEEMVIDNYISATYDQYAHYFTYNPDENPFMYWKHQATCSIEIPGIRKVIDLQYFSSIALALISIPATEAMVERCFSSMKRIATDYNTKMRIELYLALSQIKVATKFSNKWISEEDCSHEIEM